MSEKLINNMISNGYTAITNSIDKKLIKKAQVFHFLIKSVENLNGRPVVLNTSFNIKGQPIVETPLEAISTFFGSGIDVLVMGNFIVTK